MRVVVVLSVAACSLPPRPETPVVEPIDASMCAAPGVGARVVTADPTTFAAALANAQRGDEIQLATGTYAGPFELAASGVIVRAADGAAPVIADDLVVRGSDLEIRGIRFDSPSAGSPWLELADAPNNVSIIGNVFDSHAPNRDDGAFTGLGITGTHTTLCGNAFGSWLGDEVSADKVDGLLIEHNDWALASAQHALLAIVGHHVVIRENAFRNPWQRALHITDRSDDDRTEDVVVEFNTFIDSDWVTGKPNPSNDEQFMGGNEVVRFLGARGIFRGNILAGNHEGDNWACHGILNFQTFISGAGIDTRRFAQFRVYNNTFDANRTSAIIFYAGATPLDATDNKFVNNVISRSQDYAFSLCGDAHDLPIDTYKVAGNMMPGTSVHLDDQHVMTVDAAAAAKPGVFAENLDAMPIFVDESLAVKVAEAPASWPASRLVDAAYAAYQLTPESPGLGIQVPLAHVLSASAETLVVDDALFFSDGEGMVHGDDLFLNNNSWRVIARDAATNTLTVDRPITAAPGDAVSYLPLQGIGR